MPACRRRRAAKPEQAIAGKIKTAVKAVAAAKGLAVVVQKEAVVCGSVDITGEVLNQLR